MAFGGEYKEAQRWVGGWVGGASNARVYVYFVSWEAMGTKFILKSL